MQFNQDRIATEKILSDLVSIYSVTGSEEKIGNYIFDLLQSFGVDTVIKQEVTERQFSVVARVKGAKPGPKILLTGHMDTVPVGDGWETDPFTAVRKGDKLYGRGSFDMKGGVAAILSTAKCAAEHKDELPGELIIVFVPDEEAYSAGIKTVIKNGISADFGIAAEPEYIRSVIGTVGKMLIKVDVRGIAAHGCEPEKGINAIEEGSKFLAALDQIPLLSHPNITSQPYVTLKVEGGFKEYSIVVPEHCSFLINKHTVPSETKEYVLNEMEKLVKQLGLKAKFTFSVEEPYYPAYDIGADVPYLKKIGAIYEEIVGKQLQFGYGTGICDTNLIVPLANIPTISLGPYGGGMHASNEWVSIESVHEMDSIYRRFIFGN